MTATDFIEKFIPELKTNTLFRIAEMSARESGNLAEQAQLEYFAINELITRLSRHKDELKETVKQAISWGYSHLGPYEASLQVRRKKKWENHNEVCQWLAQNNQFNLLKPNETELSKAVERGYLDAGPILENRTETEETAIVFKLRKE